MTQKESKPFNWYAIMTVVGFFQIITGFTVLLQKEEFDWILAAVLLGYIFIEYIYFFVAAAFFEQKHMLFLVLEAGKAGVLHHSITQRVAISIIMTHHSHPR